MDSVTFEKNEQKKKNRENNLTKENTKQNKKSDSVIAETERLKCERE